jgi:ditrans,polycis-polyprenyl diphosphate synthase
MIELNCIEKFMINSLKFCHIPEHIAFIMDGNRRYGKNEKKQALSGHEEGTNTLKKCLLYCLTMGIKYASFYAFSL